MKKICMMSATLLILSSCSIQNLEKETSSPVVVLPEISQSVKEDLEIDELELGFQAIELDLSEYFYQTDGAAVFYTPEKAELIYNMDKAETFTSPYSTFKIMSTLIGLWEEVVSSGESKMLYNGTVYWNENWNHDLTLRESFQTSCVWYFHQMLYQLPQNVIENHLNSIDYGNCDLSEWSGNGNNSVSELNGFWLNSSLQITPRQQVYILEKIFENQTIYDANDIILLKDFMETEIPHIFAKTGAGNHQSWYVGFFEWNNDVTYFAVLTETQGAQSKSAKEIALSLIEHWETIEYKR